MADTGDKADWEVASKALFKGTLAGAKAGEEAFPEMELDTLNVKWAAVPVFTKDGEVLADTKEPGTVPFTTDATYVRNRQPKLPPKTT
jgi:hypothetical protein